MELLEYVDNLRRHRRDDDALRRALVASGVQIKDAFDIEEPQPVPEAAHDAGVDLDYTAVQWDEQASPDTWALMQQQLTQSRVTVTVPDTAPEQAPPVPEFDREWT